MARARIDSASLDRVRSSVENMHNSIASINNSISALDSQINKIEADRARAQKSLNDLNRQKSDIARQIQEQQEIVSQLSEQVTQIASALASTPPTIQVTEQCGTDADGNPIYQTKTIPNPEYAALESELSSLQSELATAQEQLSQLQETLSNIEQQISNLQDVVEKCDNSINKLQNDRNRLETTSARLQKATTLASDRLRSIERVVDKYNSVKLQQQPMVAPKKPPQGVSLTVGRDIVLPRKDVSDAEKGVAKYLSNLGVDCKALSKATSDDEKKKILSDPNVKTKDSLNTLLSLSKGKFLPNMSGSFSMFSERSPQTTGDSAEWYRTVIETQRGNVVRKEVYYDLSQHQGKKMNFLGDEEKINKPYRKMDIVVNGTTYQELKVGLWKPNKRGEIRAELYADALRLEDPAHANDKQEYRIYKSATTGYSLFDDKEQAGYILKMQERYPDKVTVYYNDVKLTLDDLKKLSN